jgi:hypothetical protein
VSENRVLRTIFGHKREEVAGGWRRLHNEELHNLCASPDIVRMIKQRRMRNWYRMLVRKPEGKKHLGHPCIDGISMKIGVK